MKHFLRDGLIWVLHYSGVNWVYRRWHRRRGPLARVLCLHDLQDRAWFATLLDALQERYHLLRADEFAAREFRTDKINLLLTFDDGYQSWVDVVLPELAKRNLQGIFFVCSGALDVAGTPAADGFVKNQLQLNNKRTLLSWEGVESLHAAGQAIGGHTVNHYSLGQLEEAAISQEIAADKAALEAHLNAELQHFAFPFGRSSDMPAAAQSAAGGMYPFLYSALPGWYTSNNAITIPRLLLEEGQPIPQIKRWIAGGYDLYERLKSVPIHRIKNSKVQ